MYVQAQEIAEQSVATVAQADGFQAGKQSALLFVEQAIYRSMALVAVLSGMRSGEIFGLRWRYVDFEERSILPAETVYQGRPSNPKPGLPIARSLSMIWLWKLSSVGRHAEAGQTILCSRRPRARLSTLTTSGIAS